MVKRFCVFLPLLLLVNPTHAALNVYACEPEWAALTQELAADKAAIYSATTALQDPHHIQTRPSLIVPALATHRLQRWRQLAAYVVGVAGYAGGLLLSVWFDLPTGAAIVWAMAVSGALFALLKRGA